MHIYSFMVAGLFTVFTSNTCLLLEYTATCQSKAFHGATLGVSRLNAGMLQSLTATTVFVHTTTNINTCHIIMGNNRNTDIIVCIISAWLNIELTKLIGMHVCTTKTLYR